MGGIQWFANWTSIRSVVSLQKRKILCRHRNVDVLFLPLYQASSGFSWNIVSCFAHDTYRKMWTKKTKSNREQARMVTILENTYFKEKLEELGLISQQKGRLDEARQESSCIKKAVYKRGGNNLLFVSLWTEQGVTGLNSRETNVWQLA